MQSDIFIYVRAAVVICIPPFAALALYFPLRFWRRSRVEFLTAVALVSSLILVAAWVFTQQAQQTLLVVETAVFLISLAAVIVFFYVQSRWLHSTVHYNPLLPEVARSGHLHLRHLFQIGIRMEEHGAAFYQVCAEKAFDVQAKKLFQTLAGDELRHKAVLQEILSRWLTLAMKENISRFLEQKIAEAGIFGDTPDQTAGQLDVLNYAISQEEKMERLYRSFENDLPDMYRREYLMRLVDEEQSHQRQLRRMKNSLSCQSKP